mmetsp:Transcript_91469/g.295980  ORF Transcript_91469/g.295980 Transcript_91469/m.295980 type:complete len:209 (+) Transcript_91469:922-1548(+)
MQVLRPRPLPHGGRRCGIALRQVEGGAEHGVLVLGAKQGAPPGGAQIRGRVRREQELAAGPQVGGLEERQADARLEALLRAHAKVLLKGIGVAHADRSHGVVQAWAIQRDPCLEQHAAAMKRQACEWNSQFTTSPPAFARRPARGLLPDGPDVQQQRGLGLGAPQVAGRPQWQELLAAQTPDILHAEECLLSRREVQAPRLVADQGNV